MDKKEKQMMYIDIYCRSKKNVFLKKENTNLASLARFTEMILSIIASNLMHDMVWKINKRCTTTIHFNVLSRIL